MLKTVEFLNSESSLLDDGPQCAFRNIFSRMIGDNRSPVRRGIIPDFVAALGMAVKDKSGLTQFTDGFGGLQGRQGCHISKGTGIFILNLVVGVCNDVNSFGIGSLCSMHDSIIL